MAEDASHQVYEFGDRNFSDWSFHSAQSLQWGSKATWKVIPTDGQEVIFSSIQMEDKNIFNLIFTRVQDGYRVFADVYIKGNVYCLVWLQVALKRFSSKPWLAVLGVIKLRDERKMAGNLSIVADLELLLLQLPKLHILKHKLSPAKV